LFLGIGGDLLLVYAISIGPGNVPKDWIPPGATDADLEEAVAHGANVHSMKSFQFCERCFQYRPLRAHHCRQCKKCVLKMDHHCVFINNCVGHDNHKSFILFVFYACIGLFHVFVLFIWRSINVVENISQEPLYQLILLFYCILQTFSLCIFLFYMLCVQIRILLRNTTTIEESVRKWQAFDAHRANIPYRWPFDYGSLRNIESVMGSSWIMWPFSTLPEFDGLSWTLSNEITTTSIATKENIKEV